MEPLAEMLDELVPVPPEGPVPIRTDEVYLDLPLEFRVARVGVLGLAVAASAPTQTFRTSVMPVFHRLRAVIVAEDEDGVPA